MKCIFLHGLDQDCKSWDETIKLLNGNFDANCPDLFKMQMQNFTYAEILKKIYNKTN